MGESHQLELPLDIGATTLTAFLVQSKSIEKPCSIVELVAPSKSTTLSDKLTTSKVCSLTERSSKKSDQDSTTDAKDYYPFWGKYCLEMSVKLWSATKTDSLGLESNLSNGTVSNLIANSWFSTALTCLQSERWLKISSQSSIASVAGSTDLGSTKLKSKKIRLYPETVVRLTWRKWLAASRWSYNNAIAYLRQCWIDKIKLPTAYQLRKIVNDIAPDWVTSTPYNPRGAAVLDAHSAFCKCSDKRNPRFRSCREQVQSLKLQSDNWKQNTTYPRELKKAQLNPSEPLCTEMPSDFSIVLDRGRWFICFAVPMEIEQNNLTSAIALDPGVRSFLTGFDGQNILEIAPGDIGKIAALCQRLDRVQSEVSLSKGQHNKRKRWKLRRLARSIRVRISNLVDDIHNKVAALLTKAYKHIFLPTFETSQMVVKKKRKICSKTARSMLSWSHYRFKQVLKVHAQKRGSIVHDVTEEYTSKTCSKCGHVHRKLGGNKKFACPECGHTINRDWNGAINILLKSLNALAHALAGEDTPQYTVDFGTSCQVLPG